MVIHAAASAGDVLNAVRHAGRKAGEVARIEDDAGFAGNARSDRKVDDRKDEREPADVTIELGEEEDAAAAMAQAVVALLVRDPAMTPPARSSDQSASQADVAIDSQGSVDGPAHSVRHADDTRASSSGEGLAKKGSRREDDENAWLDALLRETRPESDPEARPIGASRPTDPDASVEPSAAQGIALPGNAAQDTMTAAWPGLIEAGQGLQGSTDVAATGLAPSRIAEAAEILVRLAGQASGEKTAAQRPGERRDGSVAELDGEIAEDRAGEPVRNLTEPGSSSGEAVRTGDPVASRGPATPERTLQAGTENEHAAASLPGAGEHGTRQDSQPAQSLTAFASTVSAPLTAIPLDTSRLQAFLATIAPVRYVAAQAGSPIGTVELILNPPELGTVHARVHREGDTLLLDISVTTQEAQVAIESSRQIVEESVRTEGIRHVELTIRQESASARELASTPPGSRGQEFQQFGAEGGHRDPNRHAPFRRPSDGAGGIGGAAAEPVKAETGRSGIYL